MTAVEISPPAKQTLFKHYALKQECGLALIWDSFDLNLTGWLGMKDESADVGCCSRSVVVAVRGAESCTQPQASTANECNLWSSEQPVVFCINTVL